MTLNISKIFWRQWQSDTNTWQHIILLHHHFSSQKLRYPGLTLFWFQLYQRLLKYTLENKQLVTQSTGHQRWPLMARTMPSHFRKTPALLHLLIYFQMCHLQNVSAGGLQVLFQFPHLCLMLNWNLNMEMPNMRRKTDTLSWWELKHDILEMLASTLYGFKVYQSDKETAMATEALVAWRKQDLRLAGMDGKTASSLRWAITGTRWDGLDVRRSLLMLEKEVGVFLKMNLHIPILKDPSECNLDVCPSLLQKRSMLLT